MSILSAFAIYFVVWWIMLFTILPFGVSRPSDEEVVPGTDPGAPVAARIGQKLLWNTVVSAVVFAIGVAIHRSGIVSIDRLSDMMGLPF